MKFLQNKIIIGAVCIVVAGVFAFGVLPSMRRITEYEKLMSGILVLDKETEEQKWT